MSDAAKEKGDAGVRDETRKVGNAIEGPKGKGITHVALVHLLSEDARDDDRRRLELGLGDGSERRVNLRAFHLPPELHQATAGVPLVLVPVGWRRKRDGKKVRLGKRKS